MYSTVRCATHEEMKAEVKRQVRTLCAHEANLRVRFRKREINKEEYSKQLAFVTGRKDGLCSLLAYALWGEIEE